MPNTDYTDYTDYKVVYIISKVNSSGRGRPSTGIHRFKVSGGYFDEVRAHQQGIKEGQEAHHEGYFSDRYLKNSIIYQQISPYKFPGYYSVELYTLLITYPAKLQWCVNAILAANAFAHYCTYGGYVISIVYCSTL